MSTAQESSQSQEHKVETREIGARESSRSREQKVEARELGNISSNINGTVKEGHQPRSSRFDRTPSEIERAAQSVQQERMMRRRDSNNVSPDHQQRQTIQLDPEWLNSITKTVTDSGRNVLLASGQPTIYKHVYAEDFNPAVICIGPYNNNPFRCIFSGFRSMQDNKWRCVHRLVARHCNHEGSNDIGTLLVQHERMRGTYVVFVGRRPGLYTEWHECNRQVNGYPGNLYQRYKTYEEAEKAFLQFMGISEVDEDSNSFLNQRSVVTGSSSSTTQSSTHQAPIHNEGGRRDESHIRLESIVYILAILGVILSLKILFS